MKKFQNQIRLAVLLIALSPMGFIGCESTTVDEPAGMSPPPTEKTPSQETESEGYKDLENKINELTTKLNNPPPSTSDAEVQALKGQIAQLQKTLDDSKANPPSSEPPSSIGLVYKPQLPDVASIAAVPAIGSVIPVPVYRYYNSDTGYHFYTLAPEYWVEGWTSESTKENPAFYAYSEAAPNLVAVYYWYGMGKHYYTTDSKTPAGYNSGGIAFYAYNSPPPNVKTTPVFRLFNYFSGDSHSSGDYIYTADPTDKDSAMAEPGYQWEGIGWYAPSKSQFPNDPVPVYRWVTPYSSYFYTTSPQEGQYYSSLQNNWVSEGPVFKAYNAPKTSTCVAVYRFRVFPKKGKPHYFYTRDKAEGDGAGYNYNGIAFYTEPKEVHGTTPVYRLYNPANGDHLYTTDSAEKDSAVLFGGYTDQKIEWYAPK